MYSKILVPVDGTETAALGLAEAIKLAKHERGGLRLIHVVDEMILAAPYSAGIDATRGIDALREAGRSILTDSEAVARRAGVEVDTLLVEAIGGQAGAHILQHAKQCGADLIVMGTHGRRGLRRLVMGSDAEFVVRHTSVPVLLVRNQISTQE